MRGSYFDRRAAFKRRREWEVEDRWVCSVVREEKEKGRGWMRQVRRVSLLWFLWEGGFGGV